MCECVHLFHGKDLVVEVLLELLVGQVYAELLKTVVFKVLKTKNVQNTYTQDITVVLRLNIGVKSLMHSSF